MPMEEQKRKRWLSQCHEDPDIDGFLKAPNLVKELVLLHLDRWVYFISWIPLEIRWKEEMGWSISQQEERLHVFISFQDFVENDWGCENLSLLIFYWPRRCTVVVDCARTIHCTHDTCYYYIADDDERFQQLTDPIPLKQLVLDYSNLFYPNGWDWDVSTRRKSLLKRFNRRMAQPSDLKVFRSFLINFSKI